MYVNKTKVKTLVRKLARLLRQKKKEMWSTLMTPRACCLPHCHAHASVCWLEPQQKLC